MYRIVKQKVYATGFRHDAYSLTRSGMVFIFSYLLASGSITTISLIFIAQLGDAELTGSSLALTVYSLIGNAVLVGLNFGFETLLPQTFGGNKRKMGIIVQRGIIISFYSWLIIWSLMLNAVSEMSDLEYPILLIE